MAHWLQFWDRRERHRAPCNSPARPEAHKDVSYSQALSPRHKSCNLSMQVYHRVCIIFVVVYLNKVPVDVELRASGTNCSGMLCEPRGIAAVSHRFSLCLLLLLRYMRTQVSGASPSRNVPRALEARESQAALKNQPAGCSIRLCTYILL